MDFRFATPQLSLSFQQRMYCPLHPTLRAETKWWFSHPSQIPPFKPVVVDANVAGVSTGRDGTFNRAVATESSTPAFRSEGFAARHRTLLDLLDNDRPAAYLGACRLYYKPPTPVPTTRTLLPTFPPSLVRDSETAAVAAAAAAALSYERIAPARNTSLIPMIEIYRESYGRFRRISRALVNVRSCRVSHLTWVDSKRRR